MLPNNNQLAMTAKPLKHLKGLKGKVIALWQIHLKDSSRDCRCCCPICIHAEWHSGHKVAVT